MQTVTQKIIHFYFLPASANGVESGWLKKAAFAQFDTKSAVIKTINL